MLLMGRVLSFTAVFLLGKGAELGMSFCNVTTGGGVLSFTAVFLLGKGAEL